MAKRTASIHTQTHMPNRFVYELRFAYQPHFGRSIYRLPIQAHTHITLWHCFYFNLHLVPLNRLAFISPKTATWSICHQNNTTVNTLFRYPSLSLSLCSLSALSSLAIHSKILNAFNFLLPTCCGHFLYISCVIYAEICVKRIRMFTESVVRRKKAVII